MEQRILKKSPRNITNIQNDSKDHTTPFAQVFSCGMDRPFQHRTYLWIHGTSSTLFSKVSFRISTQTQLLKLVTNLVTQIQFII